MPAVGALVAIDAVVVALVLTVILYASRQLWLPFLLNALGSIPVVGGYIEQQADALILRAVAGAALWIQAGVWPLTSAVQRFKVLWEWLTRHSVEAHEATFNALWTLFYGAVPMLVRISYDYALQAEQLAVAYAHAEDLIVLQDAETLFSQAVTFAHAEDLVVLQDAVALFEQAVTYAHSGDLAVLADAVALFQQAVAYAHAGDLVVLQDAERLWQDAVERAMAGDLEVARYAEQIGVQAEGYAQTLERIAVGYTDTVGAAVAATAAAATAAVATRVQEIEDSPCQRFCSPLGDLGQLLQGLEDAALGALILELIAECRRNPKAVASMLGEVFTGPAQDALGQVAG